VTVAGSVMSPGIYKVASGTTVTQAVTQAGGVTENGKRDDVRLFRGVNETRLDLTEPEAIGMPVESGDQILVKNKSSGGIRRFILPVIQIGFSIANLLYR